MNASPDENERLLNSFLSMNGMEFIFTLYKFLDIVNDDFFPEDITGQNNSEYKLILKKYIDLIKFLNDCILEDRAIAAEKLIQAKNLWITLNSLVAKDNLQKNANII